MEHSPYSPDLAPTDYYRFPKLKKHLRGRRFSSDEYLKEAVETFLQDLLKVFLRHSLIGKTLE
jgi:histone-lysine N-methyltransferase SETMAR